MGWEKCYPQPTVWGNLPSFGLYIRHSKGIYINGLTLGAEKPDVRTPVWAEDVDGLVIKNSRVISPSSQTPFLQGSKLQNLEVERPLGWKNEVVKVKD